MKWYGVPVNICNGVGISMPISSLFKQLNIRILIFCCSVSANLYNDYYISDNRGLSWANSNCHKQPWWRHQMEAFSALLAICAGNSPVSGDFPAQRPVTLSFGVFFDLWPNKRLSKQPWGWWFDTPSGSIWCHSNDNLIHDFHISLCWKVFSLQQFRCVCRVNAFENNAHLLSKTIPFFMRKK